MTAPNPVTQSPEPVRRSGKKLIAVGLLSFLLILILAGGAGAYYFFVYEATPERVMQKTLLQMSTLTSVSYEGGFQVTRQAAKNMSIHLDNSGVTQTESEESVEINVTVSAEGTTSFTEDKGSTKITVSATAGDKQMFGPISGETRKIDDSTYLNLEKIFVPSFMGIDFQAYSEIITGRWIEINREQILKSAGLDEINEKLEQAEAEASAKYDDRLEQLFKAALPNFITVTEKLASEDIDGVPTHHYAYVGNKEAILQFFADMKSVLEEDLDSGTANIFSRLDEQLAEYENIHGEVWIGKSDYYVRKITISSTIVEDGEEEGNLSASVVLSGFSEPVNISEPENAASVEQVFTEVLQKISEDAAKAKSDDDNDGLTYTQESLYGSDPENADTDGDGFSDGEEVVAGYNPNGPGALPPPDLEPKIIP